ncbi:MAG: carboxypeptidase regulatory-like domain-containing protein [Candidatus Omnitrophota bacterium]
MKLFLIIFALCILFINGISVPIPNENKSQIDESGRKWVGIITDSIGGSIYILDPITNNLYGPFLSGLLGERNSPIKAVLIPGKKEILIINPSSYLASFAELSDRFDLTPVIKDSINIGYNAEDIAITPNGKYALISFRKNERSISVLNLKNHSLISTLNLGPSFSISGIEIAADGQTVLGADNSNKAIHVFLLDKDGNLKLSKSINLDFPPTDISIASGRNIAIVVNKKGCTPAILRIDSPGNVKFVKEKLSIPISNGIAALFSRIGDKGYYICRDGLITNFYEMMIEPCGKIQFIDHGINGFYGTRNEAGMKEQDAIALGPDDRFAYIANSEGDNSTISLIELKTGLQIKKLSIENSITSGITFGYISDSFDNQPEDKPPLGSFDSPADGSIVRSSIALTGWALDDVSVQSLKIYIEVQNNLLYIGDANFIEGARPDVANAYPSYPNNSRAGWGYMLLTNTLPYGDGVYKLCAIATDSSGQNTILGTKLITVDNIHAVNPFGAIDSPQPGEIISGTNYRIQGWVLTPQPNKIPEDGSTIEVYIDDVYIGNAVYNIYRPDISSLFPGYRNSNGALAYFDFNPSEFTNGVHTLQWVAKDSAGNTDGIGSRYFSIENTKIEGNVKDPNGIPISANVSVGNITVTTDSSGWFRITGIQENDHTVVNFNKNGYLPTYKIADVHNGISTTLNVVMIPEESAVEIKGDSGGTVSKKGCSLKLTANSLVNSTGVAYNGLARVSLTPLDPTTQEGMNSFPGKFEGVKTNGETVPFASYGLMDIAVRDEKNNQLQLTDGASAAINIPIPSNLQSSAPDTMPMWYFDSVTGHWKEEGLLTINSTRNAYEGTVRHFSYWNCDMPWMTSYVEGTIVDCSGNALPNTRIYIQGDKWITDYFSFDGNFTMPVEANTNVIIWAEKNSYITGRNNFTTAPPSQIYHYGNLSLCINHRGAVNVDFPTKPGWCYPVKYRFNSRQPVPYTITFQPTNSDNFSAMVYSGYDSTVLHALINIDNSDDFYKANGWTILYNGNAGGAINLILFCLPKIVYPGLEYQHNNVLYKVISANMKFENYSNCIKVEFNSENNGRGYFIVAQGIGLIKMNFVHSIKHGVWNVGDKDDMTINGIPTLAPLRTVTGRVIDRNNKPISGIYAVPLSWWYSLLSTDMYARTGNDGSFSFKVHYKAMEKLSLYLGYDVNKDGVLDEGTFKLYEQFRLPDGNLNIGDLVYDLSSSLANQRSKPLVIFKRPIISKKN